MFLRKSLLGISLEFHLYNCVNLSRASIKLLPVSTLP